MSTGRANPVRYVWLRALSDVIGHVLVWAAEMPWMNRTSGLRRAMLNLSY